MPVAIKTPPQNSRPIFLDLGQGTWQPLGHRSQPPQLPTLFGQARFTPEDQIANPWRAMTRVVKDVLRVGRWKGSIDPKSGARTMWDVTAVTLANIVSEFRRAQKNGVASNLTLSHGDGMSLVVPTQDLLAPLDEAVVDGDTLWVSAYVTPEQARFLSNAAMKVSPGIIPRWSDGAGNNYTDFLLHVAVTDNPVVTGQGPFVLMSNSQGGSTMDFAQVLDLFKRAFTVMGYTLPDNVTEENLVAVVEALLTDAEAGGGEEAGEEGEEDAPADGGDATAEDLTAMSNADVPAWAKALMKQNAMLMKQFGDQQAQQFSAAVENLKARGLNQASAAMLLSNAKASGKYDMAVLSPFELMFAAKKDHPVKLGSAVRKLSNSSAPDVKGAEEEDEDAKAFKMLTAGRKLRSVDGK